MTDKQFSILRTIVVGAAFFVGGAILFSENENFSVVFMITGGILLVKDYLIEIFRQDSQTGEKTEEKEE